MIRELIRKKFVDEYGDILSCSSIIAIKVDHRGSLDVSDKLHNSKIRSENIGTTSDYDRHRSVILFKDDSDYGKFLEKNDQKIMKLTNITSSFSKQLATMIEKLQC